MGDIAKRISGRREIMSKLLEDKQVSKQCIFKTNGYQCQHDGHLSTGTLGEGPWYCREHFARVMGWQAWEASAVDETQVVVDERVSKRVHRLEGESEHAWSTRCRLWVLDRIRCGRILRQPGEDAEELPEGST